MNKMPLTIFNSNFGIMEEDNVGSPMQWANCQTIGDFQENGNKVGCQIGKISVVTDNNFALSKRLNMELNSKKAPLEVLAVLGMGVSNGKSTFVLKDFELPVQSTK